LPALCGWSARVQRSYPRHLDGRGKVPDEGVLVFTGKIAPYSTVDPSLYMPPSFYSVAPMEWLFGVGYLPGRVLMIVFALGCLVLAYLTSARTGRSRLAGVSAVVLIVGYPVTLTYFATATPYAMVSCLSLALVFVLLVVRSRVLAYGTSGIILWALCHPARHVADHHDPNRLGAADRAVAKDRVPSWPRPLSRCGHSDLDCSRLFWIPRDLRS
jgi:hypothetical protein